jgi:hypothetical protein
MKKLEYVLWFLRAAINQLGPYLLVTYFSRSQNVTAIAELAPVFAAVGLANLTRSGALLSTTKGGEDALLTAGFRLELIYSLAWTIPLILLVPAQATKQMIIVAAILLSSAFGGVFAARIDNSHGLTRIAMLDISSVFLAAVLVLPSREFGPSSIALAFLVRELLFAISNLINLVYFDKITKIGPRATARNYVNTRISGTLFWAVGPWKDFIVTNVGVSLFSKTVYGAFYSAQLFWTLPVLVVGLLLRPAYKDVQSGRISVTILRNRIFVFILVSAIVLWLADSILHLTPKISTLLFAAVLMPLFFAAPVTAATMEAVLRDDRIAIVVQNIIWGVVACLTLYLFRNQGFAGIALSVICTNLSSIFILSRNRA